MRLRNMLKICLVFCKSEPAYKRYAYKKKHVLAKLKRKLNSQLQFIYLNTIYL